MQFAYSALRSSVVQMLALMHGKKRHQQKRRGFELHAHPGFEITSET